MYGSDMNLRLLLSRTALVIGALLIGVGAAYRAIARSFLDSRTFGERAAESLTDPDVATYAADRVTDALLAQKPDLIAVRPFLSATAQGLVGTRAFRAMVGAAAREAHQAVFSEGTRRVVVALPDVQVLFKGVMETVSPEVAKKIPQKLTTVVATLGDNRAAEVVVDLARAGARLRVFAGLFLLVGPFFLGLAIWLGDDRRRALVRSGTAIAIAGLVLLLVMPLCRIVVAGIMEDGLTRRALTGALYHYLLPLRVSGGFLLGLGLLMAAGGRSLFDTADPVAIATRLFRRLTTPPASTRGRLLWALLLVTVGTLIILYPAEALSAAAVVAGAFVAYAGLRELFRLLLERLPEQSSDASIPLASRWALRTVFIVAAIGVAATVWMLWSRPSGIAMVGGEQVACNGHAELCERRLDQVTFAGTHNSMSNQSIRDWMFPHHQASIAAQLQAGVRSLAIDIHYGYAGGSRIRTEMGDAAMRAKMIKSVGDSGYQAVLRIRDGLVGVNESKREMYFCHGFCELGAYPLVPTLREIRDFMVRHPDEVVLLLIEDYVDPGRSRQGVRGGGTQAAGVRGSRPGVALARRARRERAEGPRVDRERQARRALAPAVPADLAGDAVHVPHARRVLLPAQPGRHQRLTVPDEPLDRDDAGAAAIQRGDRERLRRALPPGSAVRAGAEAQGERGPGGLLPDRGSVPGGGFAEPRGQRRATEEVRGRRDGEMNRAVVLLKIRG